MANSRVGFLWIYSLIVLFATGVIELVVMPAVQYQFVPSLKVSANTTLSAIDALAFADKIDRVVNNMHFGISIHYGYQYILNSDDPTGLVQD